MNRVDYLQNLKSLTFRLNQAEKQLRISYQRSTKIELADPLTEDNLIEFEALARRFARVVDILIHKFFRSIDIVELVEGGTLIDVINRAEKRGLINSSQEIRALKDLRNDISHEYLLEKLTFLHEEVFKAVPKVLGMISNCINYAQKYLS